MLTIIFVDYVSCKLDYPHYYDYSVLQFYWWWLHKGITTIHEHTQTSLNYAAGWYLRYLVFLDTLILYTYYILKFFTLCISFTAMTLLCVLPIQF